MYRIVRTNKFYKKFSPRFFGFRFLSKAYGKMRINPILTPPICHPSTVPTPLEKKSEC